MQHFLAQAGHESKKFTKFIEGTNFQPSNIEKGDFKRYFNKIGQDNKYPNRTNLSSIYTAPNKFVDGEKYFNIIYDDRNQNRINKIGNIYDGDGYLFRGRGLLQISGRSNYKQFTGFYNKISGLAAKDFTLTPDDLIDNFEISIHASLWFFNKFVLGGIKNFQIKASNIDSNVQEKLIIDVSKKVNGGDIGLPGRIIELDDAKTKIKCN